MKTKKCRKFFTSIRNFIYWKYQVTLSFTLFKAPAGYILEIQVSVRYWPERALYYEKRTLFFLKKGHQKFHRPPYSIPFLSVLQHHEAFHNFHKRGRGQRSTVEQNIGLEYVPWTAHIDFHSTLMLHCTSLHFKIWVKWHLAAVASTLLLTVSKFCF